MTNEERLAELAVAAGANVQPGQIVLLSAELGQEELARQIAAKAYERGAKFVDVWYFDPHVKRARMLHAPADSLDFVPPWYASRVRAAGDLAAALISLVGSPDPGVFDGLDPARLGRDLLPRVCETSEVINARTVSWAVVPCPTAGWAALVHPDLPPAAALERLWAEIAHVCRLDEADPVAAWRERSAQLAAVASRLTDLRLDALRFEGPETDLTIGLLPGSIWLGGGTTTAAGIEHMPNIPTEEIFTGPDPLRADGVVRSTKPLLVSGSSLVDGLSVRFQGGRVVELEARSGADVLRAACARDEGASRLGEVALVDREGRVGRLGTIFTNTLLDENAASHLALGRAYHASAGEEDRNRLNESSIHIDFMVGGDDVDVTGITRAGEPVPVLRGGTWQV